MKVVKSKEILALVSGGENAIGSEGTATTVGVVAGAIQSRAAGTLAGIAALGPGAGSVATVGVVASYNVGSNIGTFLYNHSETVQSLSGAAVGGVMDAWYNSAVYNCVFRDSGTNGGAGGSIKSEDIEKMCSE